MIANILWTREDALLAIDYSVDYGTCSLENQTYFLLCQPGFVVQQTRTMVRKARSTVANTITNNLKNVEHVLSSIDGSLWLIKSTSG